MKRWCMLAISTTFRILKQCVIFQILNSSDIEYRTHQTPCRTHQIAQCIVFTRLCTYIGPHPCMPMWQGRSPPLSQQRAVERRSCLRRLPGRDCIRDYSISMKVHNQSGKAHQTYLSRSQSQRHFSQVTCPLYCRYCPFAWGSFFLVFTCIKPLYILRPKNKAFDWFSSLFFNTH